MLTTRPHRRTVHPGRAALSALAAVALATPLVLVGCMGDGEDEGSSLSTLLQRSREETGGARDVRYIDVSDGGSGLDNYTGDPLSGYTLDPLGGFELPYEPVRREGR